MSGYKGWFGWWETNLHSWRPKWKEVTFKEPILNLSEIKVTISLNGKIQLITDFTSCRLQAVVLSSVRPEVPSTSERVKRTFGQENVVNYTFFEAPSHKRISMVITMVFSNQPEHLGSETWIPHWKNYELHFILIWSHIHSSKSY